MKDYSQELRTQGYKMTPQRQVILDILAENQGHLSGEEIIVKARERQPHISAGTVYRNLNTLCDLGLVRRLNSMGGRRFELNSCHHHHLTCLNCHKTVEIDFCPMSEEIKALARQNGFEVADHDFEIKGYCRKCRKDVK